MLERVVDKWLVREVSECSFICTGEVQPVDGLLMPPLSRRSEEPYDD
jgi:hypothetical protein